MNVPQFLIPPLSEAHDSKLRSTWNRLVERGQFIGGGEVESFETEFASFIGSAHCAGVANGTDAITLSLRALGAGPRAEIVIPAMTFFATVEAVLHSGATPVFADVAPDSLTISPEEVAKCVGERTVGVVGVHLYGHPFDLDAIGTFCESRGLWYLEDAAQAQGAKWNGTRVGSFGVAAGWSFYPSKNLGCFGDGGAVTSDSPGLISEIRHFGNHGQSGRSWHDRWGCNSRLDALQAAVLRVRLLELDAQNERRRVIAGRYRRGLAECRQIRMLEEDSRAEPVYHQFVILTSERSRLAEFLAKSEIATAVHYPHPVHAQPILDKPLPLDACPVAKSAAEQLLSLPMFPTLADDQVDYVCEQIRRFFGVPC